MPGGYNDTLRILGSIIPLVMKIVHWISKWIKLLYFRFKHKMFELGQSGCPKDDIGLIIYEPYRQEKYSDFTLTV